MSYTLVPSINFVKDRTVPIPTFTIYINYKSVTLRLSVN